MGPAPAPAMAITRRRRSLRLWQHAFLMGALGWLVAGCSGRLKAPDGAGGEGDGGGVFEGGSGILHPSVRLVSAVPGVDRALITWTTSGFDGDAPNFALFTAPAGLDPFGTGPALVDPAGDRAILDSLPTGSELRVGLGLADGQGGWVPTRPVLTLRTGPIVYANPNSTSATQDGLTPETAYNDVFLAVIGAFSLGGGNVWLSEGSFPNVSVPLFEGVDLYGGFEPTFQLDQRDVQTHGTILRGFSGANILVLDQITSIPILDGLLLDGFGIADNGLDLVRASCEVRLTSVRGCNRGIKLRTPQGEDAPAVQLSDCVVFENTVEGFTIDGPADLDVSGCLFRDNGAEGMDADDWIAPPGVTVRIRLQDCGFLRNGAEGLDLDLAAPDTGGAQGGTFVVDIEDCDFAENGAIGALIDLEYESTPAWNSRIQVRGVLTRDNLGAGMRIDLDGQSSTIVHRLKASANAGDGLLLTSESQPGLVQVSASAFLGNMGTGVRSALGNYGMAVSHCVFVGNQDGGVRGDTLEALAHSSVAFLQPQPWVGTRAYRCIEVTDASIPTFAFAPLQVLSIAGQGGSDVSVGSFPEFPADSLCEVDDDGILRNATSVGPNTVTLDPAAPAASRVLFAFPPSTTVDEDFQPTSGSPVLGSGVSPPGQPALDAGPWGAAMPGTPGEEDLITQSLFYVADMEPDWGSPLPDGGTLRLRMEGGAPSPSSAVSAAALRSLDGTLTIPIVVSTSGSFIEITPMGSLPAGQLVLEIHSGLQAVGGSGLAAVTVVPVR